MNDKAPDDNRSTIQLLLILMFRQEKWWHSTSLETRCCQRFKNIKNTNISMYLVHKWAELQHYPIKFAKQKFEFRGIKCIMSFLYLWHHWKIKDAYYVPSLLMTLLKNKRCIWWFGGRIWSLDVKIFHWTTILHKNKF